MKFLLFLTFLSFSESALINLNLFQTSDGLYPVDKNSKIYIISRSPLNVLQDLRLTFQSSFQTTNGGALGTPQSDGSLSPFISQLDNDTLEVEYSKVAPIDGYLYIESVTKNLNVFPIFNSSSINFKLGTNVFFRMDSSSNFYIPIAQNVRINKNVDFVGYSGLPDEPQQNLMFFDSATIDGQVSYDQLELPMDKFYFKSNGVDVQYQIQVTLRQGIKIGGAGLLMTTGFPTSIAARTISDYQLSNTDQLYLLMVPRLNGALPSYTGEVKVFYAGDVIPPTVFPMVSFGYENITSTSPINRIIVNCTGPYAIQYQLIDLSPTTPHVETTTKLAGNLNLFSFFICFFIVLFSVLQ